jgi:hypothetical protein
LGAAFGGRHSRMEVTNERRNSKTAAFVRDFHPTALAQRSWAPNPHLSLTSSSAGALLFMDLHELHGE